MMIFAALKHRPARLAVILGLIMLLTVTGNLAPASAQGTRTDRDGDGLPNDVDDCPDRPGPRENRGCPLDGDDSDDTGENAPPPAAGDRDGDGVTDDIDYCIDQPGPLENGGCPLPEATPVPPEPLPSLPPLDAENERCVAATQGNTSVNIRNAPDVEGSVIGAMDPYDIYPVMGIVKQGDDTWLHLGGGYAAQWVLRQGGDCAGLLQIVWNTSTAKYDIKLPDVLVPSYDTSGSGDGDALPRVPLNCAESVLVGVFGDGSVMPGEGCSAAMGDGSVIEFGTGIPPVVVPENVPRVDLPNGSEGAIIVIDTHPPDPGDELGQIKVVFPSNEPDTAAAERETIEIQIGYSDNLLTANEPFVIGGLWNSEGIIIINGYGGPDTLGGEHGIIIINGYGDPDATYALLPHMEQGHVITIIDAGERGIIIINGYGGPDAEGGEFGIIIVNSYGGPDSFGATLGETLTQSEWDALVGG